MNLSNILNPVIGNEGSTGNAGGTPPRGNNTNLPAHVPTQEDNTRASNSNTSTTDSLDTQPTGSASNIEASDYLNAKVCEVRSGRRPVRYASSSKITPPSTRVTLTQLGFTKDSVH